jgi:hypothetical protein
LARAHSQLHDLARPVEVEHCLENLRLVFILPSLRHQQQPHSISLFTLWTHGKLDFYAKPPWRWILTHYVSS